MEAGFFAATYYINVVFAHTGPLTRRLTMPIVRGRFVAVEPRATETERVVSGINSQTFRLLDQRAAADASGTATATNGASSSMAVAIGAAVAAVGCAVAVIIVVVIVVRRRRQHRDRANSDSPLVAVVVSDV